MDARPAALALTALLLAGCGSAQPSASPAPRSPESSRGAPSLPPGPGAAAVAPLAAAVAALEALPTVRVTSEANDGGGATARGSAVLDQGRRRARSERTTQDGLGTGGLTTFRVLAEGSLWIRSLGPDDDPAVVPWSKADLDPQAFRTALAEVLTDSGELGESLDDLVDLVRDGPFELAAVPSADLRTGATAGLRAEAEAADLARYLAVSGREAVVDLDAEGTTRYTFWLSRGVLVGLDASGTQFRDGEPLPGVSSGLTYAQTATVGIEPPAS